MAGRWDKGCVSGTGHSAPGPWEPKAPRPSPGGLPWCRRPAGRRAAGTAPHLPAASWGPRPFPEARAAQEASPRQQDSLAPQPRAPTAGGGAGHAVSLARPAASSSQGPVCLNLPGPESPSGQALRDTGPPPALALLLGGLRSPACPPKPLLPNHSPFGGTGRSGRREEPGGTRAAYPPHGHHPPPKPGCPCSDPRLGAPPTPATRALRSGRHFPGRLTEGPTLPPCHPSGYPRALSPPPGSFPGDLPTRNPLALNSGYFRVQEL